MADESQGDASILHYLFDLVDVAAQSNNTYVRSQRYFALISAYAKHSRQHSAFTDQALRTVITPPNQNANSDRQVGGALTGVKL